jgi:outer membrane protein assembly factor BamD (BamD/ComL family)
MKVAQLVGGASAELSSTFDRDRLTSARTFYQAGRGSYDRGDVESAKLYFGLAEKLFSKASENVSAYIAREWYNYLSQRGPQL